MLLIANKIEKISLQIPVRKIDTQNTVSILWHLVMNNLTVWNFQFQVQKEVGKIAGVCAYF